MLNKLLKPEVRAFIKSHENSDLDRLLFNKSKYPDIPIELVVDQIRARAKAKSKMPLWFDTDEVVMPPLISMEQSSSEEAALYKTMLFKGDLAIDLTGGAGVDAYYLSKRFKRVIYIDLNKDLADIAKHNFKVFGVDNIDVLNTDSEEFILNFQGPADLIYIDPARRNKNQKLFLLQDCSPNILNLQLLLLEKAIYVMVKASPMLDISKALSQLSNVNKIHVVAIKNEVKELLFIQSLKPLDLPVIKAIDLTYNLPFECQWNHIEQAKLGELTTYLYEPNATILKSGKGDVLASNYNLTKLNSNTHLFTSAKLEQEFPGRVFKINRILKYDKKEIKMILPSMKANIATRNFPDSVDDFRKKTGIKPGGNHYIFAYRDISNNPKIVLCSKI